MIRRRWEAARVDGPSAAADHDPVPAPGASELRPPADAHRPGLAVFLFADIRGYTHFTTVRGAEAAAELAGRFTQP
jgi:class 3 adenylate cyclase